MSDSDDEEVNLNQSKSVTNYDIKFAGFGFSFINEEPKELMYICFNSVSLQYKETTLQDLIKTAQSEIITELSLAVSNIQIDNLLDEKMPVLLGA